MHELPFAKSIYRSVMEAARANNARRVRKVSLEVGVLRDFVPELVQKYWDYIAKGDIAERSQIVMTTIAATARCGQCGEVYEVDVHTIATAHCPKCDYPKGELLTGRELRVVDIEIE